MSMTEWAKREIEIACKRERRLSEKKDDWDYGVACYESAYRAFKSLMDDNHSGLSLSITRRILNRLIDGNPLTPIEDSPDIWYGNSALDEADYSCYQCERMSSLFKYVYHDGSIKYKDTDRVVSVYSEEPNAIRWHNGFICRIIDEMYPITMPYSPFNKQYVVHCKESLSDPKNGDYDTLAVLYVVTPTGERESIDRFFKEEDRSWVEISKEEYEERENDNEQCKGN